MKIITIKNSGWGKLSIHEGKLPKSRLEFRAGNDLEIWLSGPMTDCYDLMACKATQYALDMGLKATDLRLQRPSKHNRQFTTESRKLL